MIPHSIITGGHAVVNNCSQFYAQNMSAEGMLHGQDEMLKQGSICPLNWMKMIHRNIMRELSLVSYPIFIRQSMSIDLVVTTAVCGSLLFANQLLIFNLCSQS